MTYTPDPNRKGRDGEWWPFNDVEFMDRVLITRPDGSQWRGQVVGAALGPVLVVEPDEGPCYFVLAEAVEVLERNLPGGHR